MCLGDDRTSWVIKVQRQSKVCDNRSETHCQLDLVVEVDHPVSFCSFGSCSNGQVLPLLGEGGMLRKVETPSLVHGSSPPGVKVAFIKSWADHTMLHLLLLLLRPAASARLS